MLTEEVQALLDDEAQNFDGALEESNPPPEDQLYAQAITKVSARKVNPRDKTKGPMTVIRVGFKVVDDGPWKNYNYIHDFWPGSFRELVTFAQIQAGTAIKGNEVGKRLSESVGQTIFYTEIKRTKNDEGREFVHIKALKKLTAAPVVSTPPAG